MNAHALYRDFLVYVNGVLKDHNNNTNITLQVGDHFSVVARAVGNVTFITANGTNFTCVTGFACNNHTRNDVHNRYLNCYLNSPVEPSDSGKTLAISVNNVELKTFVITGECVLQHLIVWVGGGMGRHYHFNVTRKSRKMITLTVGYCMVCIHIAASTTSSNYLFCWPLTNTCI